MPRITVDFSDVQDFEAVPDDEYPAIIVKAEYREPADDAKFPYINLEMDITEPKEYKGRKLWSILSLSPKALWRTKQTLENIGVYEESLDIDVEEADNGAQLVTKPELVGLPVRVQTEQEPYEGRMQNRVKTILSADGAGPAKKASGPRKAPAKASGPARGKKSFK